MATEDEKRIALEIMKTVRRLQLPFKLDGITEGRGNCFPLAIQAQCRRPEILEELHTTQKNIIIQDPTTLRKSIHQFISRSTHATIQQYKITYEEVLAVVENKTWEEYWKIMIRNYEWVNYVFMIITTTSTMESPYITISGNLANEQVPCGGVPLIIGTMSNIHYQSLLPVSRLKTRRQVKPHLPDDSISLEVDKLEGIHDLNVISEESNAKTQHHNGRMFTYHSRDVILNFQFIKNKIICPTCKKPFLSILQHLKKSNNCEVKDHHDLSKKLLQFQNKTGKDRMAALRENQRNIDNQNVKDNQNKWAEKSRRQKRAADNQKVKDDQKKRKGNSRKHQRAQDNQKVKDDQKNWKGKSMINKRTADNQKVK